MLADVQADLEVVIAEKGATIISIHLPSIEAIPSQMHQLFYNLLNNALKFSKPDMATLVNITFKKLASDDL